MGWDASLTGAELFEIEADFSAKIVTFRLVEGMHPPHKSATGGGDASLTGAELFEIEADFSAKIVTFRLVEGMHPPINPPLVGGMHP